MPDEITKNYPENPLEPIRSKDGREDLPDDVNEKLRDAVWAGLAQKMQEDKAILCRRKGHIWVEEPGKGMICQRCGLLKSQEEQQKTPDKA